MTAHVPLDARLHGAAQQLLIARLGGSEPASADPRDVVSEQDAVDAALMLSAAIEEQVLASRIAPDAAARMAALLMVVRDYVRPLPPGLAADGSDLLTQDLGEMVRAVRLTR